MRISLLRELPALNLLKCTLVFVTVLICVKQCPSLSRQLSLAWFEHRMTKKFLRMTHMLEVITQRMLATEIEDMKRVVIRQLDTQAELHTKYEEMKRRLQAFATRALNEATTSDVIPEQRVASEEKTTTTTSRGAGRRSCFSVRQSFPQINEALEELARSSQFSTQNMKIKVEEAVKEVSGGRLPSGTSPASWLNRYRKIAGFQRRYEEHYLETIHRYNNSDEQTLLRELSKLYLKEGRKTKRIPQEFANFLLDKAERLKCG